MKVASIIFVVLGMILNFFYSVPMGVIGVIIGIIMICTLAADKKSVLLGVLGIIFTGLLGGIFYLCWNPGNENN